MKIMPLPCVCSLCILIAGDVMRRVCTAAEIKFYFKSYFRSAKRSSNYLAPNKNCNLTSWIPGCEPGWACSVGPGQKADLRNSKDIPTRTDDCAPCCEGFFCPHGITCMIRKYVRLGKWKSIFLEFLQFLVHWLVF